MSTFHQILIPTDFSDGARRATRAAGELSRQFGAPVTLVYVFERSTYPMPDEFGLFTREQLEYWFGELNERLKSARQDALDAGATSVTTRLLQGWAPAEITRFAREAAFDLIVMGTRGRTGLPHLFLGSVAERVVRMAHCPVLTLRQLEAA